MCACMHVCMYVVVQSLSCVQLFVTLQTAARPASLSLTIFLSLLKLMFIESVMPFNHLTLCGPLLLLPSVFPSIRIFPNEQASYSHQVAKALTNKVLSEKHSHSFRKSWFPLGHHNKLGIL